MRRTAIPLALAGILAGAGLASPAAAATGEVDAIDVSVIMNEAINLAAPGFVAVAVLSAADLDATSLDASTAVLGADDGVGVALRSDGSRLVTATDVDGDDRDDLVLHFDTTALVDAGELGPDSERLTMTGALRDGRSVTGSGSVRPEVTLEIKLAESLRVAGPDAGRRSAAGAGVSSVEALLDGYDVASVEPLFSAQAQAQAVKPAAARARTARAMPDVPDLGSWFSVTLAADTDVDATVAALQAMDEVAYAYPAPQPAPPPAESDTPDFTGLQGYLRPAPEGIDADFSRQDPRARGEDIRIVNLEYSWHAPHEDLQMDASQDLGGTTYPQYTYYGDNHGTAVFGQLVGLDNDYGVTGGVPDAEAYGISPIDARGRYRPADAMLYAAGTLRPGDVLLIEQQQVGPNGGTKYVPLEWTQSVFEANVVLDAMGVVVVQAGGNGGENLDAPEFQGRFDRSVRDSNAIIVGASTSTDHSAMGFSSHGSRVDLHAWGQNITTTGYGNLYGGTDQANKNFWYSRSFSGTSGASPIVTSAVVAVQSYLKATGQGVWTADQITDLLRRTGTPYTGDRPIGPMPDIAAALKEIEVDAPITTAALSPAAVGGWYADPTVTLTSDDGWGAGVERTEYRLDGGAWTTYTGAFPVTGDGEHALEYRSVDTRGNVEDIRSTTFQVDATAPVIEVSGVTDGETVGDSQDRQISWTVSDPTSGMAASSATLDGVPVFSGDTQPLHELSLGEHVLEVTAIDIAGNVTTHRVTFTTTTSLGDLRTLVTRFQGEGRVTAFTAAGLHDRLRYAERLAAQGSETRTIGSLEQFVARALNQIKGDAADISARDVLVRDARALIAELELAEEQESTGTDG